MPIFNFLGDSGIAITWPAFFFFFCLLVVSIVN